MSLLEDLLAKDPFFVLNSQYKNIQKLTNGSFSDIFTAETVGKQTQVIVKAPHKTAHSYAEISKEAILLLKLKELKTIPKVLYLQANSQCEVLVLEKLGSSLEALKQDYNNFSLKTIILLADQLLNILEDIHRCGVVHRDVKPSNILIGEGSNRKKVYLIDFDISSTLTAGPRPDAPHEFIGTKGFASRNAHKGGFLSRKDDLESLGFTLVYLYQGKLPWNNLKCDVVTLGTMKSQLMQSGFLEDLPKEFARYFEYLDGLKQEEIPDYEFLRKLFEGMAQRFGFGLGGHNFEWEEEERSDRKEDSEKQEEIVSEDSTSEDSIQKKVFSFNKGFNQKFLGQVNRKGSSDFMQGFKAAFLKSQAMGQQ